MYFTGDNGGVRLVLLQHDDKVDVLRARQCLEHEEYKEVFLKHLEQGGEVFSTRFNQSFMEHFFTPGAVSISTPGSTPDVEGRR